jgi:hypothetical protein
MAAPLQNLSAEIDINCRWLSPKLVQKKEVIAMVVSSTTSRRLFKLCVATIVAIAMVVTMVSVPTAAYADQDDRQNPKLSIGMYEHAKGYSDDSEGARGPTTHSMGNTSPYSSMSS